MKRFFAPLLVALAVLPAPTFAQEVTLRVHHFLPTSSTAHAKILGPWCERLAKDSAGRIKCQIYPSMQLGGTPAQLYDQARDGVADVVWTLLGYTAGRFPLIEVFELPFMMTTAEATSRAVWDYAQTHAASEFKDVKPLAFHVHEPGHFFLAKQPVAQLADLKGLKLRAPTRVTNKMLAALGATPVGMPVPQVTEALSKGVIDGALLPYEVVPSIKVHEVTRYASETDARLPGLYTSVFMVAMNKAKYDSLPPDLKKVVDANSGIALSALAGRLYDEAAPVSKKVVLERGNVVNVIPAAELEKWKQATDRLDDEWMADVGKRGHDGRALLQAAKDLIAKQSRK
ncbi:MAG: TRAP transporter substrate-binding protein [Gammaproteobacteria bacterium]|nr:TRAP transporter substrate-binding protein [Gammaproteobacteria bacterium]MBU1647019.1 TRAP transporter substrate-binding protein [Gammaproteobacteria bacterium]MBU1972531.1 TRAP transporter substrate-binding protein [Gammaproteobacteria bacterium]